MGKVDRLWSYWHRVLVYEIDLPTEMPFQPSTLTRTAILSIRHLFINSEEAFYNQEKQNDVLYVKEGSIVLRNDESKEERSEEARKIRSEEKHQFEKIHDEVAKILGISFPYKTDHINHLEDTCRGER